MFGRWKCPKCSLEVENKAHDGCTRCHFNREHTLTLGSHIHNYTYPNFGFTNTDSMTSLGTRGAYLLFDYITLYISQSKEVDNYSQLVSGYKNVHTNFLLHIIPILGNQTYHTNLG